MEVIEVSGLISKISINSYRGITSLQLENLQKINILTGDNNSGKTSVLEIIHTFQQPDILRSWIDVSREDTLTGGISIYESLNDLFNINMDEKRIVYGIETESGYTEVEFSGKDVEVEATIEDYNYTMGYISDVEEDRLVNQMILLTKTDFEIKVNQKRMQTVALYEGQRRRPLLLKKNNTQYTNNVVYISPFRHTNGTLYLSDILNYPDLYEEMLNILKEFDPGIISINYDEGGNSRFKGYYKILSKENNKALPLNMYGDGMKKAILLMSAVVKAKDGILLLDEFETAIHTSAMDKVFKWLLDTCIRLNVQVFMTTHSEEAIDKVLNCSEELQAHMAIYTLYKDKEGNSVRRLDARKAITIKENMGLELR